MTTATRLPMRMDLRTLPSGWQVVRLGDVCDVQLGKMLSPASKTGMSPQPYLRNANVQWGRFDLEQILEMDFDEDEMAKFALRPGDLLVCEGGEPGRAAIWDGAIQPCYYQKALHRLRPSGDVEPRIVLYRLRLGALFGEFTEAHGQTTIAHLPAVRLKELRMALPPPAEQRRIAAILDEQMAAIERARAAAKQQREAAHALPASYLRAVFESDEAKAWPRATLDEALMLRRDVIHPYNNPSGPATFVGLEHIESGTGERTGALEVEMSALTGRKPQFFRGDLVYGYLRPYLNKVWVADFDGLCSVDQYVFKVRQERALPAFVAWFMRSPTYLERAPIDTTPGQLPRIRTEEVLSVTVPLPTRQVQERVVKAVNHALAASRAGCAAIEAQLRCIDAFSAASLRSAFRGEL